MSGQNQPLNPLDNDQQALQDELDRNRNINLGGRVTPPNDPLAGNQQQNPPAQNVQNATYVARTRAIQAYQEQLNRLLSNEADAPSAPEIITLLNRIDYFVDSRENANILNNNGNLTMDNIVTNPNRDRNIYDNYHYVQMIMQASTKYGPFFARNCAILQSELRDFRGSPIIFAISMCEATHKGLDEAVWYLCECVLPGISDDECMNDVKAKETVCKLVLSVFLSKCAKYFFQDRGESYDRIRRIFTYLPVEPPSTVAELQVGDEYAVRNTDIKAMVTAISLEITRREHHKQRLAYFDILRNYQINMYLAIAKSNVTAEFRNKFLRSIQNSYPSFELMSTNVRDQIKAKVSPYLAEPDKAKEVFTRWNNYFAITDLNMRVKQLLLRAIYQNITTYRTISEIMKSYNDFAWPYVAACFPVDMQNFLDALNLYGDGDYVGFIDTPTAKWHRTKFSSLGWICFRIGILTDPDVYANLQSFAKFSEQRIRNHEDWNLIIARYAKDRNHMPEFDSEEARKKEVLVKEVMAKLNKTTVALTTVSVRQLFSNINTRGEDKPAPAADAGQARQ